MKKMYRLLFCLLLTVNLFSTKEIPIHSTEGDPIGAVEANTLDNKIESGFLQLMESVYEKFLKNSRQKEIRIEWLDIPGSYHIKGQYLDRVKLGFKKAIEEFSKNKKRSVPLLYVGNVKINKEELKEKQGRRNEGIVRVPIRKENPLDAQISCTAYPLSKRKGCKVITLRCWITLQNKGDETDVDVGEDIYNPSPVVDENEKNGALKVSALYRCPECIDEHWIGPGSVVHTGGKYWFHIKLPDLNGYLIVYQRDSKGKVFNLFPGTKKALLEGHYRIPLHLFYDCSTNYLEAAAKNSKDYISDNSLLIGSYKFDNTLGDEEFFFYYSDERSPELERDLLEAIEIGKDISPYKGADENHEPEAPKRSRSELERAKMKHPIKISKVIKYYLKHKEK